MTTIAFFNGEFLPVDDIRISPNDRGFLFADGVYEVVRAYGGRFFRLEQHLARLARGLCELNIAGPDSDTMRQACAELLTRNALDTGDCLVYVQVTRGAAPRSHAFPRTAVPPTVYATPMPIVPRGDPAEGVAVITTPDIRWARCDIKSVALLPNCLANQRAKDCGATEAIFVRDGVALEGTATTLFGVFDGVVRTSPATNYILPGVTREAVLELCDAIGIPAHEGPIYAQELGRADELFLTGTTVEVLPVVRVDGGPVADGRPGPIAHRLLEALRATTV